MRKLFYLFDLKINKEKFSKEKPVNYRSLAALRRWKYIHVNKLTK